MTTAQQTAIRGNGRVSAFTYRLTFIATLGGFLFGYDTAVISGTTGFVTRQFSLDAVTLGWFVSCALLGCVLGVSYTGILRDKLGTKPMLVAAAALFSLSAIGCMLAESFSALVAYRFIGGLGVGMASILSPLYIAEIAPPQSRGRLVSYYQLAITVGILLAYFANSALLDWSLGAAARNTWPAFMIGDGVWRAMLGSEALPALLFLVLVLTVPESPRWLAAKGKVDSANSVLRSIYDEAGAQRAMEEIQALESARKKPSLTELFRKYRIPTLIGVTLALLQQLSGINAVIYYGPDILARAGFQIGDALSGQVIIGIVNVLGTFVAVAAVDRFGRRPLLVFGASGALLSLMAIGMLFRAETPNTVLLMIAILGFIACFAFSYGPVVWIILSEIFPMHMRGIAMSVATGALWIGTVLVGQMTPYLLETIQPTGTFWLFAACTLPALYLAIFVLPETKGRSLEEIEQSWTR